MGSNLMDRAALEDGMSELIVIGFDDHATAERAYAHVQHLRREETVTLKGVALISVDEHGQSHVDTPGSLIGTTAAGGAAVWGIILGALFLIPVAGVVIGGVLGGLFGKLRQFGIDDEFRRRARDLIKPGGAAVVVMASDIDAAAFGAELQPFGGEVLRTSLSDEQEEELAGGLEQ